MWLFVLFVTVPIIEIALFIQIGGEIGLLSTLGIVIATAFLGTYLVRKQGLSALSQLKNNVETLENPIAPLAHGIMILLAGALLLTPGFFTDAVGFSLLVPNIRIWLFERVKQRILHSQNGFSFTHARTGGAKHSSQNGERQASGTTIEGVYEELAPKNDP
ncbi:FxsA family protein [Paracoccaceae bacterium]|jgi:UPF0716 protein FxsA|nr:FxsA family protein [Paracoccaceae bacterium]